MSLNSRIFLAYFFVVGLGIYFLLNVIVSELKPGVRQSTEDALVDMANILAEVVADEFIAEPGMTNQFAISFERFIERTHGAKIFSIEKHNSHLRIYITDSRGIVRYDSTGTDLGQDYSQWNDVYLTLRGQYGARTTEAESGNRFSTVMHVAAPIKKGDEIVGVLTVAKPNWSVQPFIDKAKAKIQLRGSAVLIASLILAGALSYWLTSSIRRLSTYADKVGRGENASVPHVGESELANLANSMDAMRRQLEGKEYVEQYIHSLTHELKSPVSAIKGASEIISPEMNEQDLARFMGNIQHEVTRIDELINRLLELAGLEKQEALDNPLLVDLADILNRVIETKASQIKRKNLSVRCNCVERTSLSGDEFLLTQALDNVLQNAIDFSPPDSNIYIDVSQNQREVLISIRDEGAGIPEYALDKIFDRFYSLPRPDSNKKSSGLGLSFVDQIMALHLGSAHIENRESGGTKVTLRIPA